MGARLWWVDFQEADLSYSDLYGADLTNAFLVNADLRETDLSMCIFNGCNLAGTDLSTAILSKDEKLDTAYGVRVGKQKTQLPSKVEAPTHWYDYEEEIRKMGHERARSYRQAYLEFIQANPKQLSKFGI